MKYKINVINEIRTNAISEEEFIKCFNEKLAAIIIYLESNLAKKGCKY